MKINTSTYAHTHTCTHFYKRRLHTGERDDRMSTSNLIPHYITETNSTHRKTYFYLSQSKTCNKLSKPSVIKNLFNKQS